MRNEQLNWHERDWDRLIEQIGRGDCMPFLGSGVCQADPTHSANGENWSSRYGYPFHDQPSVPTLMQFARITVGDSVTVKQHVKQEFGGVSAPDFTDVAEPHALLARQPIPVYVTTKYDDFMTRALERAQKSPLTVVCPWHEGLADELDDDRGYRMGLQPSYRPQAERPIVFHLHGSYMCEESLVLDQQDHIEFLSSVVRDTRQDDRLVIPHQLLRSVATRPLLFLGYSLREWSFMMLLHGVIEVLADVRRRRHLSVQVDPGPDDGEEARKAREFLVRSFDRLNIAVYWGEADDFCVELAERMGLR